MEINQKILDAITKVQPLQAEILKTGRSCHIYADNGVLFVPGKAITWFAVTIFEENEIVKDFDFSSSMTQEELDAEYASLLAYVHRITSE